MHLIALVILWVWGDDAALFYFKVQVHLLGHLALVGGGQSELVLSLVEMEYLGRSLLDFFLLLIWSVSSLLASLSSWLWDIIVSVLLLLCSGRLLLLLGLFALLKLFQVSTHRLQELLLQVNQQLLLLLLLFVIDCVVLLGRFLEVSLSLCHFQVLLSTEFSFEYWLHYFLLFWLEGLVVKRLTQTHYRNCSISISNSCHWLHDWDGGQRWVRYLLTVGYLVLSIVEVPDINESIHPCQEEETGPSWWPASIGQVTIMITSLHYGSL